MIFRRHKNRRGWGDYAFTFLFVSYCALAIHILGKLIRVHELDAVGFGAVVAAVFVSAYPMFGWGKTAPYPRVGRWSLVKWCVAAAVVGLLSIVINLLSSVMLRLCCVN